MDEETLEIVTVVNRTHEHVSWMYDGREYLLAPLETKTMRREPALHGYSKTRYGFDGMAWHRRLGIKELGHDCQPIQADDPDAPAQYVDQTTKREELGKQQPTGGKKVLKKFSNPDLAMARPVDGF